MKKKKTEWIKKKRGDCGHFDRKTCPHQRRGGAVAVEVGVEPAHRYQTAAFVAGAPAAVISPPEAKMKTFPSVSVSPYSPSPSGFCWPSICGCPSGWECAPARTRRGAGFGLWCAWWSPPAMSSRGSSAPCTRCCAQRAQRSGRPC